MAETGRSLFVRTTLTLPKGAKCSKGGKADKGESKGTSKSTSKSTGKGTKNRRDETLRHVTSNVDTDEIMKGRLYHLYMQI